MITIGFKKNIKNGSMHPAPMSLDMFYTKRNIKTKLCIITLWNVCIANLHHPAMDLTAITIPYPFLTGT